MVGLTTWSGLRVLSERQKHDSEPESYDPDEVRRLTRQTDYLVLGSVALGLATGAAGIWLVNWHSNAQTGVALTPGGLALTARRHF
jgi:hypothetical protein